MPLIYKRFTDKSAEEWRQIYKVRVAMFTEWLLYGADWVSIIESSIA